MTRTLKFRAWDKKRKEWYNASDPDSTTFYGFHLFGECTGFCYPSIEDLEHLEITQFTGIHDSTKWEELTEDERTKWTLAGNMPSEWNGKPIYDGDIISFDNIVSADYGGGYVYDKSCVYRIIWNNRLAGWEPKFDEMDELNFKRHTRGLMLQGVCKVIGNVFENPELLEVKP